MKNDRVTEVIECLPEEKYRYATMSVAHLEKLQSFVDTLYEKKIITDDEIVQSYISKAKYTLPDHFTDAKSIIILAYDTPPAKVTAQHNGQEHEIIIPPQYFATGLTKQQLDATVQQKIIKHEGYRLEKTFGMLLKQIAVRSGLGAYGRNNLVYVDGFGTYHTLHMYLTDYEFEHETFRDVTMMKECTDCTICRTTCPTKCIPSKEFIINAGRCLSVHSERSEPFPDWVTSDMHNALVGCMRCQSPCPINKKITNKTITLPALSEVETMAILNGDWNTEVATSLSEKLRMCTPDTAHELIPLLKKNLGVLIPAVS